MSTSSALDARSPLPGSARIVIIGGGVGGASVAYHLAERGERDVVLLERAELTSGSTFHSAGLVGQLRADPTLTRMNMYSVELYRRLQAGEHPPGWVESGGIKLASSPERLEEIRRQIGWARLYDLPLVEISPAEASEMFPPISTEGLSGAAWLSSDGYLDPSSLCMSLAAHARRTGVQIHTRTRVLGIEVDHGAVRRVRTDAGDIDCEIVVNCAGMYAAQIARMVGVRLPIVPMSHQYLITASLSPGALGPRDKPLPTLRDPDLLVYWRSEIDGLLMGGYERDPAPWTASPASLDDIPADFNGRLLAADWDRFTEITHNATVRVPAMADAPIRKLVNGPEGFTPDNEFCLGPTDVAGFMVAAGFCAHGIAGAGGIGKVMADWILDGDPGMDLWHMDVRRFGPDYRSPAHTLARTLETYRTYYDIRYPGQEHTSGRRLHVSPVYSWHAERGASFGEKAGWERVNYYPRNASGDDERLRPAGWAGRYWSPAIAAEHRATREVAGLFDESSFAKIAVTGPDAARFLEWCCANVVAREVGSVTYTQMLNDRGGIEADVTVTRLADEHFLVVTGTAFGHRDLSRLRSLARRVAPSVGLDDVTPRYATFALWGPAARKILGSCTSTDLSDKTFGFLTAQQLRIAGSAVHALRVSFAGELGWELYPPSDVAAAVWQEVWRAGAPFGLMACGYRAIDSLRLEKGYRVWGADITPETTPLEAGLAFCVKLDHPAKANGFLGQDALREAKAAGPSRRLCCITLDDPRQVVLGGEGVRPAGSAGPVTGKVTSGGFGYTVQRSIAYAYLPIDRSDVGTRVEVELFGAWAAGVIAPTPLLDPRGERLR